MKTQLFILTLLLCYSASGLEQQNQTQYPSQIYLGPSTPSQMTQSQVIRLSRAGISDDVIIEELRKSNSRFQLTSNDIIRLKNAGVSQRVIQAMINPQASAPANADTKGASAGQGSLTKPLPESAASDKDNMPGSVSDPGVYVAVGNDKTKILGQPVTFERTGSRLVSSLTLTVKAAHDNVQLPGNHAQTATAAKPIFVFVPSRNEIENGVTAGDLLLVKLEVHGDRRQFEVAAGGSWRASRGVSITHQLSAVRSEIAKDTYQLTPEFPLVPGEYALYLQRGEGLPALIYDFSVQNLH